MNLLADRKIFLFGLLGVVGSLAGWAVGEGLLFALGPMTQTAPGASLVAKPEPPPALESAKVPPAPPAPLTPAVRPTPPPPPPPEFADRLDRAGAKTGAVQISLLWNNTNDLDLHCIDASGEEICYRNRKSSSGGELDVDQNCREPYRSDPIENIYFATAPLGRYQVYVNHYSRHDGADPTKYKVNVLVGGRRQEFAGAISSGDAKQKVCEFEVKPAEPSLRLAVPETIALNQGGTNRFKLRIARDLLTGPVSVSFIDIPPGILLRESSIPGDRDEAEIEVAAEPTTPGGTAPVRVLAAAGSARAEGKFLLTVNALPPALRLSVPGEMQLNQGGSNRMRVRIARDHFVGPVTVRLGNDVKEVSGRDLFLAPGQDEGEIELSAGPTAPTGSQDVAIIAAASPAQARARLRLIINPFVPPAAPGWSWLPVLLTGSWTVLLTLGLSLSLVAGQNGYLGRPLFSVGQVFVLTIGGVLAGLLAGGIGQALFHVLGQAGLMPQIGFVISWTLLGGLLGHGAGAYVPNLNASRAGMAGACGGLLGGLAFLPMATLGDQAGRLAGSACLGGSIGLMVALVEAVWREGWLEIRYGPRESRTVSLGRVPVSIGSDPSCTVFLGQAPAVALRYRLVDGRILCEDVAAGREFSIQPGDVRYVGKVQVVACVLVPGRKTVVQEAKLSLYLSQGGSLPLAVGKRLKSAELPGLVSCAGDGVVAEVVTKPDDTSVLGLKNLSQNIWSVTQPDGSTLTIVAGRSILLRAGARFDFGPLRGEVR